MKTNKDELSLLEHIAELRLKLIISVIAILIGSIACFSSYESIFTFFFRPFSTLEGTLGNNLFINYVYEGFMIKLKLSMIAGTVLTSPVHFFNILLFIFPGLTKKERRTVGVCLVASVLMAAFGFMYGYFYITPISIRFLTGKGFIPEGVGMLLNFDQNIFYIVRFLLGGILIFQLPIILEILLILNLIDRKSLLKASRYVILGTVVISALFTPPDFISQLAVSIPLIFLYFFAILIAFIFRFGNGDSDV